MGGSYRFVQNVVGESCRAFGTVTVRSSVSIGWLVLLISNDGVGGAVETFDLVFRVGGRVVRLATTAGSMVLRRAYGKRTVTVPVVGWSQAGALSYAVVDVPDFWAGLLQAVSKAQIWVAGSFHDFNVILPFVDRHNGNKGIRQVVMVVCNTVNRIWVPRTDEIAFQENDYLITASPGRGTDA